MAISKLGKVTLLKTAAQIIPNFWMNMFLLPLEICDGFEKKMNVFWWTHGRTWGGIKWLSWSKMCEAKGGGLGFKHMHTFNIAMLEKQGWRLLNNMYPLVTKLMSAKYFQKTSFLDATLGVAWRSILAAQESIRQGCRRRIGDGKSTRVWQVPWLSCLESGYITTELPEELKDIQVHGFLMKQVLTGIWRWYMTSVMNTIVNSSHKSLFRQEPETTHSSGFMKINETSL